MSTAMIEAHFLDQLAALAMETDALNKRKIGVLFEALGIAATEADLLMMLDWDLILVAVPDKQMAVQLNKLSAYIPNLKFTVDPEAGLFALSQGLKQRRVWKER